MSKEKLKRAFELLTLNNIHWFRQDKNHIGIWTSGYKMYEHYSFEKLLKPYGLIAIKEEFDKVCGKTVMIYKHK